MKVIGIGLAILIGLVLIYWGVRFFHFYTISKGLVRETMPYEDLSTNTSNTLLVLGDSTAVGVGASSPIESLPALVARAVGATYVENHAVSGAVVADLPGQIAKATRARYDRILVQIGANDIVRFHNATMTANTLAEILGTAPEATQVFVISAGDVGSAILLPPPLRPLYSHLNAEYHEEFTRSLSAKGYTYIDLSKAPRAELFNTDPQTYLAADGFHPSTAGYVIWFEAMQPYLVK